MPYQCEHCPQERFEDPEDLAGHMLGKHSESVFHDEEYLESRRIEIHETSSNADLRDWSEGNIVSPEEREYVEPTEGVQNNAKEDENVEEFEDLAEDDFPEIGESNDGSGEEKKGIIGRILSIFGL